MYIYFDDEQEARYAGLSRSHPWERSAHDDDARYVDFRTHPELIEESLEDFKPFADYPAIRDFYKLLRYLNGSKSDLETNDAAFLGPAPNPTIQIQRKIEVHGRLAVFYRDLSLNTDRKIIDALCASIVKKVTTAEPNLRLGCVAYSHWPHRFLKLVSAEATPLTDGDVIALTFWAWGDDNSETFANLHRVVRVLSKALRDL